jgi:predicted TPR repeat methyltransferase
MLSACTGEGVADRASDEYVKKMFDRFAFSFDEVLARLEYRAPTIVGEAIHEALGSPKGELDVLDAGCGTGLTAPILRLFARKLVGIDLSEKMLARARERALYDELEEVELTRYLEGQSASYDLVASVDTLVYFGDLSRVARGLARALRCGGRATFTVEKADPSAAPDGYRLNPHGRYGHTESYLRHVLEQAGLEVATLQQVVLRMERHEPVAGYVVVALNRRNM